MDRITAFSAVRFLKNFRLHSRTLALAGTIVAGSLASPALAAREPSAKLVRCGDQSCLRVSGHRDDPISVVRINGYVVQVEGERHWKAYLPMDVVREWSVPNARSIELSIADAESQQETIASVDLPIGLLADGEVLASLVINVH